MPESATSGRKPPRILMVGPQPEEGVLYSGPEACVELFTRMLQSEGFETIAVSTLRPRKSAILRLLSSCRTLLKILWSIRSCQVVFLFSTNASLKTILTVINPLARFFDKPVIVKKFGGRAHSDDYRIIHPPTPLPQDQAEKVTRQLRRVALYLPETKYAAEIARKAGIKTIWLPNFRPLPGTQKTKRKRDPHEPFRFAFVARVTPEKGVHEIIRADSMLRDGIQVDVYGPFSPALDGGAITEKDFEGLEHVRYCGVLPHENVLPTLETCDAFVFPSYYPEGHPGSLVEAISLGLPVVTTNRPFINEVVDETCALFVEAKNPGQLAEAMNRLAEDEQLCDSLSEQAKIRSEFFDIKRWEKILVDCCTRLGRKDTIPDTY